MNTIIVTLKSRWSVNGSPFMFMIIGALCMGLGLFYGSINEWVRPLMKVFGFYLLCVGLWTKKPTKDGNNTESKEPCIELYIIGGIAFALIFFVLTMFGIVY